MSHEEDDDLNEAFDESTEEDFDASDTAPVEAVAAASEESGGSSGGGGGGSGGEDDPEARTVSSRQRLRDKMESEIDRFLSSGGKITVVAPNVTADPPRKPESNYGGRPI